MSRPIYSIRFPIVVERTRVGRRISKRLVADQTGLFGARACAAGMVTVALSRLRESRCDCPSYRSPEDHTEHLRLARLQMRESALWARLFAGQIDSEDARLASVRVEIDLLVKNLFSQYCAA